jgi:hypothetical protein
VIEEGEEGTQNTQNSQRPFFGSDTHFIAQSQQRDIRIFVAALFLC